VNGARYVDSVSMRYGISGVADFGELTVNKQIGDRSPVRAMAAFDGSGEHKCGLSHACVRTSDGKRRAGKNRHRGGFRRREHRRLVEILIVAIHRWIPSDIFSNGRSVTALSAYRDGLTTGEKNGSRRNIAIWCGDNIGNGRYMPHTCMKTAATSVVPSGRHRRLVVKKKAGAARTPYALHWRV